MRGLLWQTLLSLGCCCLCMVESRVISTRSIPELAKLLFIITGRQPLQFNNYGNYCGLGGSGEPVDELDRCCQTHDQCYGRMKDAGCEPHIVHYNYLVFGRTAICLRSLRPCVSGTCECDLAAANCFAKAPYDRSKKTIK